MSLVKFKGRTYKESQVKDDKLVYDAFPPSFWVMPSDPDKWQERYSDYLKTDLWKDKRAACIDKFSGSCALCRKTAEVVHHRHYDFTSFGHEGSDVLTALCRGCHHLYHNPYPGLEEVRGNVKEGLKDKEGCVCPVCDQFCKLYKRKLNSGMTATLCWIVKEYNGEWINVPEKAPRHVIKSNEHGKLVHWGLLEGRPNNDDATKKECGFWKPTELGIDFVHRLCSVPSHVYLYNNKVHGFTESVVDIDTALGSKFDYSELMGE